MEDKMEKQTKENQREYLREWRENNKDKMKEYYKRYYEKNKESRNKYHKGLYEKNRGKVLERQKIHRKMPETILREKEYREKNKDKITKRNKEYGKNNRTKISAQEKQRIKDDPIFKMKKHIRGRLRSSIKIYSTKGKVMPTNKYLDIPAIIKKLTPFPKDRENYHVDHIVPLKMFDHDNPEQVRRAWSPENLQWLTVEENLEKGDRLVMPHYNQGGFS